MNQDSLQLLKEFFNEYEILVVDKNSNSRNRLVKILIELGTKRNLVHSVAHMEEARELLDKNKIGFILSDYDISGGSGFDLFRYSKKIFDENQMLIQVLVTSNISQTAIAKAAEEDVDGFIIKPYTVHGVKDTLISILMQKLSPSDYVKKINEGKIYLKQQKYKDALNSFQLAFEYHPRPSLALSYVGLTNFMQDQFDGAKEKYQEGLNLNKIHYKCLIGLYDILKLQKNNVEAYEVVRKISNYFPANPDRMMEVIRLTVITKNFSDISDYYELFMSIEERSEQLINHVGAGLIVAGKFFLKQNDYDRAYDLFDKAVVSCPQFPRFIKEIICSLIDANQTSRIEDYLQRFSFEDRKTSDYLISEFLVQSSDNTLDNGKLIKMATDLINQNITDSVVVNRLIELYQEEKLPHKIENLKELVEKKKAA